VFEIDEGVGRPQLLPELLAGDDMSRTLEQPEKDAKGLLLEGKRNSVFPNLAVRGHLEAVEVDRGAKIRCSLGHGLTSDSSRL
jgi:hypothetical protein